MTRDEPTVPGDNPGALVRERHRGQPGLRRAARDGGELAIAPAPELAVKAQHHHLVAHRVCRGQPRSVYRGGPGPRVRRARAPRTSPHRPPRARAVGSASPSGRRRCPSHAASRSRRDGQPPARCPRSPHAQDTESAAGERVRSPRTAAVGAAREVAAVQRAEQIMAAPCNRRAPGSRGAGNRDPGHEPLTSAGRRQDNSNPRASSEASQPASPEGPGEERIFHYRTDVEDLAAASLCP